MPELPEVETTRRGITPHVRGETIQNIVIRERRLRWPVPATLNRTLSGQAIHEISRRGKYLLFTTDAGTLILHLGMSGSLRVIDNGIAPEKHDHVDIVLANNTLIRFRDPRRFGAILFTRTDPSQHKLLSHLGPEPLERELNADYLFALSRKRRVAIKSFIMDSRIVVGVGNIYANEALFLSGIHPRRAAGKLNKDQYRKLAKAVKHVLRAAIKAGGTSLRDFTQSDGKPGYFRQSLHVYGKTAQACPTCSKPITHAVIGQRSTYYCTRCQK